MTDPLRVLCVTPAGIEGRGGIDRLYHYLRGAPEGMAGIDVRYCAARGDVAGPLWPLAFPARLLAAWRAMRTFRPDIVHVNFANRGSAWRKYAVIRLAKWSGARVVAHLHDSLPLDSLAQGGLAGRLFLAICGRADRVVALGGASAAALERAGVPNAKIRVALNGIPDFAASLAVPKPRRETVSILLAGRVGAHKGVGILLDALSILDERGIGRWACVIAGDGEVEAYSARAAALGLSDRARFIGWLDSDAVHALMREADIVALPSIAEALPLSLIEGACAGAALVATAVGNIAEVVVDGETGLLIAREPEALADALARLLGDPNALARMQAASRRRYEDRLTLDGFAAALRGVYRELGAKAGNVGVK